MIGIQPRALCLAASAIAASQTSFCHAHRSRNPMYAQGAGAFASHTARHHKRHAGVSNDFRTRVSPSVGSTVLRFSDSRHPPSTVRAGVRTNSRPERTSRGHTALSMSFLPPENENKLSLTPILFAAGIIAFFVSPLGGLFFAVTNTLFLFAFLTPIVLIVGFQVWTSLNLVQAPCPSCSATAAAKKGSESEPSPCLNCGCWVRTTRDGKGLELCNAPNDNMGNDAGGFGDIFGSKNPNIPTEFSSIFDTQNTETSKPSDTEEIKKQKMKEERESTVIDIDVDDA